MSEELKNALKIISLECSKHKVCKNCPLYIWEERQCMVRNDEEVPCDWSVNQ